MASTTVNTTIIVEWTEDGAGKDLIERFSLAGVTKTKLHYLQGVDDSGWFEIYDASDVTIPPLGNDDPADAPFELVIASKGAGTIVRFTDSVGALQYLTVDDGKTAMLPGPVFGSTENAARIEAIHVKATAAGTLTGKVLIHHD